MIENFLRLPRGPVQVTADLLRLLGVISVVVAGVWWSPTDAGVLAFALPALFIPRFVGVRAWFDVTCNVVVLVAAWSNVFDLYTRVAWWDLVVHFVCTGVLAALAYLGLSRFGVVTPTTDPGFRRATGVILGLALGLAVSALWEMVEWAGYTFISDRIYVTYDDTISDMAIGGLGALLAGLALAVLPFEPARQPEPAPSRVEV